MEKFSSVALALAFTKSEEIGAVQSTVAWAMAALDMRLGWSAPVKAGMDGKTAIKMLRETHGYRKDANGDAVLDSKGNRAKRSAVFNRLALVEKLVAYMAKSTPAFVTEMHVAAIEGDADRMESAVRAIGATLCEMAGDDTLDALGHFLATGKQKPKDAPPVKDALAELAKDAPLAPAPAPAPTPSALGNDPIDNFVADTLAGLDKWADSLTVAELNQLAEKVTAMQIAAMERERVAAAA